MKTKIKLQAFFIVFAFMLFNTYSCNGRKKTTPPPPPPQTTKPVPVVTPVTLAKADLMILNAKLEKAKNADKWYTHVLIVNIRNNGESVAKGFNIGCTYNCPGGLTNSGGADVVQGGFIAGNSEFTYRSAFHIYCEGPPAILDLKFEIDSENKVVESNENNNEKMVRVAVPF